MSINQDDLYNLYTVNKIIKKDGTIDLTDLEILSSLNNFIKSHTSMPNSSLKLNEEDLLELININKNSDDTRNFLEKFDTINDTTVCSNNIELIIDDSIQLTPPPPEPPPEPLLEPPPEPLHEPPPEPNVNLKKKTRKKSESKTPKPSKKSKKKANQ